MCVLWKNISVKNIAVGGVGGMYEEYQSASEQASLSIDNINQCSYWWSASEFGVGGVGGKYQ